MFAVLVRMVGALVRFPGLQIQLKKPDWRELIDTLQVLWSQNVIHIRKWVEPHGFVFYEGEQPNEDFFCRGDFQIQVTPDGRRYCETLEKSDQVTIGHPVTFANSVFSDDIIKNLRRPLLSEQMMEFLDQAARVRIDFENTFGSRLVSAAQAVTGMQMEFSRAIQPIMEAHLDFGNQLARVIEQHKYQIGPFLEASTLFLEKLRPISEQAYMIAESLPRVVQHNWSPEVLAPRLRLVEDALRNVSVWEQLKDSIVRDFVEIEPLPAATSVSLAGQFVFDYDLYIRRLPPLIPADEHQKQVEQDFRHRDEEVGAKLEESLAVVEHFFRRSPEGRWVYLSGRFAESIRHGDRFEEGTFGEGVDLVKRYERNHESRAAI